MIYSPLVSVKRQIMIRCGDKAKKKFVVDKEERRRGRGIGNQTEVVCWRDFYLLNFKDKVFVCQFSLAARLQDEFPRKVEGLS